MAFVTAADLQGVGLHGLGLGLGHSDLLSILKALSSIDAGWLDTGVAAASCAGCSSDGIGGGGLVRHHQHFCLRYDKVWDAMLMKENKVVQSDALAETHQEDSEEDHVLHQTETLIPCSKYCDLYCEPSDLSRRSGYCKYHTCFVMPEIYQIRYNVGNGWSEANELMQEVEYGDADYSVYVEVGFGLLCIFSAQLCQCEDADTQILVVLDVLMKGFVDTILTPMLLAYHSGRRPSTLCFLSCSEFSVLQILWSGRYTSSPLQAAVHIVYAFFVPLGLIRRRQVRASSKSFLRFSGEDSCVLSSVMHPLDLQLNPLPQMRLLIRLLVEPLALRLVRLQEAPEEYNCRLFAFGFSPDLLAGSFCTLLLRHYGFLAALCQCVHLGTIFVNSDFQSTSCRFSIVTLLLC